MGRRSRGELPATSSISLSISGPKISRGCCYWTLANPTLPPVWVRGLGGPSYGSSPGSGPLRDIHTPSQTHTYGHHTTHSHTLSPPLIIPLTKPPACSLPRFVAFRVDFTTSETAHTELPWETSVGRQAAFDHNPGKSGEIVISTAPRCSAG